MTGRLECKKCHRPMLHPSLDKLGPICRAKLAGKTGVRIGPMTVTRTRTALVDGQISLLDKLEEEQ